MRHRSSSLHRVIGMLAAGMLAAVGAAVAATPANAGPIACNNMTSFTLVFRTAGDDLRSNSEVMPFLTTRYGGVELQHFVPASATIRPIRKCWASTT